MTRFCALLFLLMMLSIAFARPDIVPVTINLDLAPMELSSVRCLPRATSGGSETELRVRLDYANVSDEEISAFEFVLLVYGPFDELLSIQRLVNMLEEGNLSPGAEAGESGSADDFRTAWGATTCVVLLSAVRFGDGTVWRADLEIALESVENLFEEVVVSTTIMGLPLLHFDGVVMP